MDELQTIIKNCKNGKREAQAKLFQMFAKKMFAVALVYAKDRTAAEDIIQDAFIKIFEKISQFNNEGSFEGWIRRIVVNTSLERYRKENRLYSIDDYKPYEQELSYDDLISNISAGELMQIISSISPQYKVVFSLYAIEGYSHKEIAEQLAISEGTSKSNLARARKVLQDKVNELYYSKKDKLGAC